MTTPGRYERSSGLTIVWRIRLLYALLLIVGALFSARMFYLQIIRHDYYAKAALRGQLKEYEIPAERGLISVYDNNKITPLVLNEKRYTLFADPKYSTAQADKISLDVSKILGVDATVLQSKLSRRGSRYEILAKKLTKKQKERLDGLHYKGIGTREETYRTYPQGQLAAQVLGFVNDEGAGQYGIEESLNKILLGTPGQLKAITDAQGIPLVSNKDNIVTDPVAGKQVVLTLDITMQRQLEDILKQGLDSAKSTSGSALILDPKTGAIKAMANFPTYNPADFQKVEDQAVFSNANVSSPLEVGSIMKPLTAAAALNQQVVSINSTYYDPSFFVVDTKKITNIAEDGGPGTHTIADILQMSLNTGATWLLMQMGGGTINQTARTKWHEYMVDHYQFGKKTGVEQSGESTGYVPDPNDGFGLNIQYANTSFGQGMSQTPLQMASALAAVVNGGTYYKPTLVSGLIGSDGNFSTQKPVVVKDHIVDAKVSEEVRSMMVYTVQKNHALYTVNLRPGYNIGGKTGTAQIGKPDGGYYDEKSNGTFYGFVGGDTPEYVVMVRVNEPNVAGYAGPKAAAPIFAKLVDMLINNFGVSTKTN